jgi:NADPH2:quinone reductase
MTTARVVEVAEFGAPEVMKIVTKQLPAPGKGEALIKQTAIGFNYLDISQRAGAMKLPLPTGIGHEAAGVVEAIGEGVTDVKVGDRVAYMNAGIGAYADYRNVAAGKLVVLPASVSDEAAATLIFKGMTAQYLVKKTYAIKPGDLVLVHSAAGGVGQILASWAKALGATVVGTASTAEKCAIAKKAGCDFAIDYSKAGWVEEFLKVTGGKKAAVVYDAVGKDTFYQSLDCAAQFGMVVLYGAASGPVTDFAPELLNAKGCLFLTRPSVFPHNADPATFRANAADLFEAITSGKVKVDIGQRFKLDDIVKVHAQVKGRATTGAVLITP